MTTYEYLLSQDLMPGVSDFINDINKYFAGDGSGVDPIALAKRNLLSYAMESEEGARFYSGGSVDKLFTLEGMDDIEQAWKVVSAITRAVDEERMSWEDLEKAIADASKATEIYEETMAAVGDEDPTSDVTTDEWKDMQKYLKAGGEEAKGIIDDLRDDALSYSESLSDYYLATAEGIDTKTAREAVGRLYEKYRTANRDLIKTMMEREKDMIDKAYSKLYGSVEESWKPALGYGTEGFDPLLAYETEFRNFAEISGGKDYVDSFLEMLEPEAEQAAAAIYLMNVALEDGVIAWKHLTDMMSDGKVTFEEIVSTINDEELKQALEDIENFSSWTTRKQADYMYGVFGDVGSDGGEQRDILLETIKHYHDLGEEGEDALESIQEAFDIDDKLFEDMKDGVIDTKDGLRDLQKAARKLNFEALEEAGVIIEGTSEAFELAEKNGAEFNEFMRTTGSDLTELTTAWEAYQKIVSNTTMTQEEYEDALQTVATYLNVNEKYLAGNMGIAFQSLQADASQA